MTPKKPMSEKMTPILVESEDVRPGDLMGRN